jgi:hypothetical protein
VSGCEGTPACSGVFYTYYIEKDYMLDFRPEVNPDIVCDIIGDVTKWLNKRIRQKGWGPFTSVHETRGSIDDEFEMVDGRAPEGSQEGCMVFKCATPDGGSFDVTPKGTFEEKREMFLNLESYIGKQLTVRYQEKSEDGIPIFPVGITVRDYE